VLRTHADELRAVIAAYNTHFNDFTGGGFSADVDAIISDKDERIGVDHLLACADESLPGVSA